MPPVIGWTTRVGLPGCSEWVRLPAHVRPPPSSQLKSQCFHHLAAKLGGTESLYYIYKQKGGENARDFCISQEPGESKEQRECTRLYWSIIFAVGILVVWKLSLWCQYFLGSDLSRGGGKGKSVFLCIRTHVLRTFFYDNRLYPHTVIPVLQVTVLRLWERSTFHIARRPLDGGAGFRPRRGGRHRLRPNSFSITFILSDVVPDEVPQGLRTLAPSMNALSNSAQQAEWEFCDRSALIIMFCFFCEAFLSVVTVHSAEPFMRLNIETTEAIIIWKLHPKKKINDLNFRIL